MACVRQNKGFKELSDSIARIYNKYNITDDSSDMAQNLMSANNGYPLEQNSQGKKSLLYEQLKTIHDKDNALFAKGFVYSNEFIDQYGDWRKDGIEPMLDSTKTYFTSRNGRIYVDNFINYSNNVNINDKIFDIQNIDVSNERKIALNEKNALVFKSLIEQIFPEIPVNIMSKEEIINTIGLNTDGFVDSNGVININSSKFNAETGLHELGHILQEILKVRNPESYNDIINQISNDIGNESSSIGRLSSIISNKYSILYKESGDSRFNLSNSDLITETFSELIAIGNKENLIELMVEANEEPDLSIYEKLKQFVNDIFNQIKSLFSKGGYDIYGSTIEDLNKSIERILKSNGRQFLSHSEAIHLQTYFSETGNHYKMDYDSAESGSKKINNLGDLRNRLVGDDYKGDTSDSLAEQYSTRMEINKVEGEDMEFHFDGNTYIYPSTLTHNELKQKVKKEITEPLMSMRLAIKSNIVSSLAKESGVRDIEEALSGLMGKATTELSIANLIKFMNLEASVKKVIQYKDLANDSNPVLRSLYNEDLAESNPLIVVHDIQDSETPDISILDVTNGPNIIGSDNIFSEFMPDDNEYMNTEGALKSNNSLMLTNTDIDSRNLAIGFIIVDMQKRMVGNIRFRNLGTMSVGASKTTAKLIHDNIGLINNITILENIDGFMDNVENEGLKTLISNAKDIDTNIKQSYFAQLRSYLLEMKTNNYQNSPFGSQSGNFIDELFDSSLSVKEQLKKIEELKSYLRGKSKNNEQAFYLYKVLAGTSRELRTGEVGIMNDIMDQSNLGAIMTTMANSKSDYVQDVVNAVQISSNVVSEKVSSDIKEIAGTTSHRGVARDVLYHQLNRNPELLAESLIINRGSKIFEHMYKEKQVNVVDESGKILRNRTIKVPELHYDLNDKQTKKAYSQGIINDQDIEFANKLLDKYEERWIDLFVHEKNQKLKKTQVFKPKEFTREQAKKEYDSLFKRGEIPVIEKSSSELLVSGKFKKGLGKTISQVSLSESLFDDMIDPNNENFDELTNVFTNQRTVQERLKKMGITIQNGSYVVNENNESKLELASTDAWKTFLYFDQSIVRKIEHETRVLPVVENSRVLLGQLEELNGAKTQQNNLKMIEQYVNKNLSRRSADDDKSFNVFGKKVKISSSVRILTQLYSTAVLPLKLSIGVASFIFNTQRMVIEGLSRQLTGSEVGVPKLSTFYKATGLIFNKKEFGKIREMGLIYKVYNRTERDLVNSPWTDLSNFKFYQEAFLNIFNWGTDTFARLLTMTAVMLEDGSYDAHTYNNQTGEVEYDEKLDKQYYNSDGTFKSNIAEAEYKRVRTAQIDEGTLSESDTKLKRAYDFNWTTFVNGIVNKYIIGSFSDDSRALLTNTYLGHAAGQFRLFSLDRLFNAGLFADTRKTTVGRRFKHFEMEDGTIVTKRDAVELESMFNSLQAAIKVVVKEKKMTPSEFSEWYSQQSDARRYNLVKTITQLLIFAFIYAGTQIGGDDDDRAKKFLDDVLILGMVGDVVNNPFPAVAALTRFFNGDMTQFIPASGVVKETIRFTESLDGENNNKLNQ